MQDNLGWRKWQLKENPSMYPFLTSQGKKFQKFREVPVQSKFRRRNKMESSSQTLKIKIQIL